MKGIFKSFEFVNLLSFLLIYSCSLTFLYGEGDDAITIAYHASERNEEIQPSYYPYQGMMDTLLSFLPSNETLLRHFAIILSSISAITFIIVLLRFIKTFENSKNKISYLYFCILLPFIIPEFFFLGLLYIASTLAISLLIMSHLIIRKAFTSEIKNKIKLLIRFIVSIGLIGLGTSFRWDTGLYVIVILVDLTIISFKKENVDKIKNLKLILLWAILSLGSILFFIYLSGFPPQQIIEIILYARNYDSRLSLLSNIGNLVSFITPAFFLFFILGVIRIIIEKKYEILLLNISVLLPFLFLNFSTAPKQFIYLFPCIILIIYRGFDYIFYAIFNKTKISQIRNLYLISILILILLPWLLGIQINSYKTAWGPGFDIRNFSTEDLKKIKDYGLKENLNIFHNIDIKFFQSGNAIPTLEGPRSLWGYGPVLLNGDWRKLIKKINKECNDAINLSIQLKTPIILNHSDATPVAWLINQGYKTRDPDPELLRNLNPDYYFTSPPYIKRKFINDNLDSIEIYYFKKNHYLFDSNKIIQLMNDTGHKSFICLLPSSSNIALLKIEYSHNAKIIDPFIAILNF